MRRVSLDVWMAVLVLAVNAYAVLLPANSLVMDWFHSDDAFYYFKTAQNIAEGHGITFDGLGRDSGFHPLWMALITPFFALARYDLILPLRLVVALSALLSAGTAVILARLARRGGLHPLAAALVGLLWAFFPLIHQDVTEMGLESPLSAFLIALLIYRAAAVWGKSPHGERVDLRSTLLTGLVAALTVLARLDNIFLVLLVGAWVTFRPARARYLLLGDAALIMLGVVASYLARVGLGPQAAQTGISAYWMIAAALLLRVALYYLFGLYNPPEAGRRGLLILQTKTAGAALLGSALLSGVMLGLFALRLFPAFPRLTLAYEGVFALFSALVLRLISAPYPWRLAAGAGEDRLRWGPTIRRGLAYFVPLGAMLAAYMLSSLAYFGTPMPVSGQIKRWWGTLPNPIYGRPVESLRGLLGFFPKASPWALASALTAQPAFLPEAARLILYGGLAALLLLRRPRRTARAIEGLALFPLLAGSFVQLISYTGTGYLHMRPWYWASQMMLITLVVGLAADALLCWWEERAGNAAGAMRKAAPALIVLLCVLLPVYGAADLARRMPMQLSQRMQGYYMESIHELEAETPPGAKIGSTGGGVIAYFVTDRTIVNLDGLMNTHMYFQALQSGAAAAYLDNLGLQYVYATANVVTSSDPYFQFKGRLAKVKDFGGATLFQWK